MRPHVTTVLLAVIALRMSAASIQTSKPEEVGLSSERLQRIHQTIQRHIDGHDITGAVTLVARKGRIAHFEAQEAGGKAGRLHSAPWRHATRLPAGLAMELQSWRGLANTTYFSGAGGLMTDAGDYLQFGQMLLDGGQLNGRRLLSPRTVDLMSSAFAPDTQPGRARGRGFGLSVQVVSDPVAAGYRVSAAALVGMARLEPTFGWIQKRRSLEF